MKKTISLLLLGLCSLYAKPTITVSIVPQTYFIEKIAGDTLNVNVMVGPGANPATYEPKPKQMIALEKSDAYFAIGVPFEATWLVKFRAANPKLSIIDTAEGITKLMLEKHHHEDEKHTTHKHEEHKDHHEEGAIPDPHIWLDPLHVKTISTNITKTLSTLYPQNKALYEANLDAFSKELDALHVNIQNKLASLAKKKFMVYHPSWGYLASRYGLEQEAIEIEGKEPKPSTLIKLINEAKEEDIHLLIVAPQFSQKSAKVIAEAINGKVVSVDHLSKNWKEELLKTVDIFAKILK